MSENFLEQALEANHNTNQMLYALAASSQRQAQLRAIEAQREVQAKIAATEQERLRIEQHRLELEIAREEAAKADALAVKTLRRILAEIGADIETIKREAGRRAVPNNRNLHLAVAKSQASLDLISSRYDILSDLGDMKEVKRLENEYKFLIQNLGAAGQVSEDPLASLEKELVELCAWASKVHALMVAGDALLNEPTSTITGDRSPTQARDEEGWRIGTEAIRTQVAKIGMFARDFPGRARELASERPTVCFVGKHLDPRVSEVWRIRAAGRTKGWVGLRDEMPDFVRCLNWIESSGADGSAPGAGDLAERLQQKLRLLSGWESASISENAALSEALKELDQGEPSVAAALLEKKAGERFFNPLWNVLEKKLRDMRGSLEQIGSITSPKSAIAAVNCTRLAPLWSEVRPQSTMGVALAELESAARARQRHRLIGIAASGLILLILCLLAAPSIRNLFEEARQREEAERQAKALKEEADRRSAIVGLQTERSNNELAVQRVDKLLSRLEPLMARHQSLRLEARSNIDSARQRAVRVRKAVNEIIIQRKLAINLLKDEDGSVPKYLPDNNYEDLDQHYHKAADYSDFTKSVLGWRRETDMHGYHRGRIELRREGSTTFAGNREFDEVTFSMLDPELTGFVGSQIQDELSVHLLASLRLRLINEEFSRTAEAAKPIFQVWLNETGDKHPDIKSVLIDYNINKQSLAEIDKRLGALMAVGKQPGK